ncbi:MULTISPECIES: response regulator [Bacillaceae]|jgi:two-component system, chemotaxis family, sensor kinase CheA|uniref:response regulator n=1 Tax=Bacillaceae TaxID=186817 RepID=UPI00119DA364|nr:MULTISPECIES: response regulator [Bacillaceae]MCM3124271.1 response regulator [Mesobacillus sp. MER 33]MCM3235019.1 response regulator [Mesobacillus sp. MER 48]
MGFKKKQYVGLGLTVLFLFILLFTILAMMNSIRGNLLEIVEDRYAKVSTVMEIRKELYQRDRNLVELITEYGEEEGSTIEETNASLDQMDIGKALLELETILNRKTSKVLVVEVQDAYREYAVMENKINGLIANGASQSEVRGLYQSEMATRDVLFEKIEEFKDYQEELMNSAMKEATGTYDNLVTGLVGMVILAIILITGVMLWVIRDTVGTVHSFTESIKKVNYDDLSSIPRMDDGIKGEFGEIARAYNSMAVSIEKLTEKEKEYNEEMQEQNWIQSNSVEVVKLYGREVTVSSLAENFMKKLTPIMDGNLGVFYLKDESAGKPYFKKIASFADEAGRDGFVAGQGMIGQCAEEKRTVVMDDIPADYRTISTGLGDAVPKSIVMAPVMLKDEVVAVVEVASLSRFTPASLKLLENVLETLGIGLANIIGRMEVERLLLESQAQTEELQAQSEELQSQSEELQAQSEELQMQTEELRMMNEQLEERTRDAELKSEELQAAKEDLEQKARELEQSSTYKSEFLANMSHELRTPLNSILLLSEMLLDDEENGLSDEQKEFSKVIHSSGQDLLNLINDILDLSKVEAGKLEVSFEEVFLDEFTERMERQFAQAAKNKKIDFTVEKADDVTPIIYTDEQRLQQILKNLLSNAFKFTEKGSVSVKIEKAYGKETIGCPLKGQSDTWVKFSVTDSGIGIPKDKQRMIFEAFQQVDGATMRKYGGTGLGLSISREFAMLLGGVCKVESKEGEGSTFTLIIPNLPDGYPSLGGFEVNDQVAASLERTAAPEPLLPDPPQAEEEIIVGETTVLTGKTVVIADDDHRNIFTLKNVLQKEGMKVVTADNGEDCLEKMKEIDADIVLMDIMMPVMDGYEAIRQIRRNENNKELPIIALTAKAMKGDREKCLDAGANDYISKPMKLDQLLSAMRVWLS